MNAKPDHDQQTALHESCPDDAGPGATQSSCPVSLDQTSANIGPIRSNPTTPETGPAAAELALTRKEKSERQPFRFSILQSHAKGGLGEVFLARDHELEREVALKEIQEKFSSSTAARERFVLEARITGGLEHPGIVPVYGCGAYPDGRLFYAMRFIRGQTMKEAIESYFAGKSRSSSNDRRLGLRILLGQFIAACNAIAYAHSRGVLHRDIKPANIMLGRFGETLVVDWGLAKSIGRDEIHAKGDEPSLLPSAGSGSMTQHGSTVGTPAFMSPEQAAGSLDEMNCTSDVYSLGATLFVILAGEVAFAARQTKQIISDVIAGKFPSPRNVCPDVPRPLEAICLKAMSLKTSDRYPTALALAKDVSNWLADEPVSAQPETFFQRAGRWTRRHRTASLVGLACLVSFSIAATSGLLMINQEKNRTLAAMDQLAREQQRTVQSLAAETEARRQAREALNTLTDDMLGELLARQVSLTPADRNFFDRVVRQLELLAETDNRSPGKSGDIDGENLKADALLRIGNIQRRLGEFDAAGLAYESAFRIWTILIEANPDSQVFRQDLAATTANLGLLSAETGDDVLALARYTSAIDMLEGILELDSSNHAARRELAKLLGNQANTFLRLQQLEQAEAACKTSGELFSSLAISNREDEGIGIDHARSTAQFASLLSNIPAKRDQAAMMLSVSVELFSEAISSKQTISISNSQPDKSAMNAPAVTGSNRLASPQLRNELAAMQGNLALTLMRKGQFEQAAIQYRTAIEDQVKVVNEYPALTLSQLTLSRLYSGLARCQLASGTSPNAEMDSAKSLLDQLVIRFPERPQFHQEMAAWMEFKAEIEKNTSPDAARSWFQQAELARRELALLEPENRVMALDIVATQINHANYLRVVEDYDSAIGKYQHALSELNKISEQNEPQALPSSSRENKLIRTAQFGLADSMVHCKRYSDALPLWAELGREKTDSNWVRFEMQRAICTVRTGEIESGILIAEKVSQMSKLEPVILYDLGCCFAVAAEMERTDSAVQTRIARAIEFLNSSASAGFFRNAAMREHAAIDPDLNSLRNNPQFEEFCKVNEINRELNR